MKDAILDEARRRRKKMTSELARTIAAQAEAIADETVIGPVYAAVQRLKGNVTTLESWIDDDRGLVKQPQIADHTHECRRCGAEIDCFIPEAECQPAQPDDAASRRGYAKEVKSAGEDSTGSSPATSSPIDLTSAENREVSALWGLG